MITLLYSEEEFQIEALRKKLKAAQRHAEDLQRQRDMWRDRSILHEKACKGLQVG